MKTKTLVLIMAVVLMIGCAIGGSLAWLTDETNAVTNTFTTSDVDIELNETKPSNNEAKMVPGATIEKDPKVTVKANSEKCYLFVKIEENNRFDDFMTYVVDDGWTDLTGVPGVYYRVVDTLPTDQDFYVLKGNAVSVNNEVTKVDMDNLTQIGRAHV